MKTLRRILWAGPVFRRTAWLPLLILAGLLAVGMSTASAGDMVPYRSTLELAVTVNVVNDGWPVHQVIEGTGNTTHLGKVSMRIEIDIDAPKPHSAGLILEFTGIALETAANGDTLEFAVEGAEILPIDSGGGLIFPLPLLGTLEVTGGTGRFENATGAIEFWGFDQDHIDIYTEGCISSVGSIKN